MPVVPYDFEKDEPLPMALSSASNHLKGEPEPPEAVQLAVPPVAMDCDGGLQEGGGPLLGTVTVTAVHGPQLLASFDSTTHPAPPDQSLSAQARM